MGQIVSTDGNNPFDSTPNSLAVNNQLFHNHLISLHRILLILRNLCTIEKKALENLNIDTDEFLSNLSHIIYSIREFPLYFPASEKIIQITFEWNERLEKTLNITPLEVMSSYSLFKEEGAFSKVESIVKDIYTYISEYANNKNTTLLTNNEYRIFDQILKRQEITFNNALDEKRLSDEIEKLKEKLKKDQKLSESVNNAYEEIKKQHSSFTAFVEQNYNNATKKIYEEIFETENNLANTYRSYAIKVFGVIAFIACIMFLTPWWFGVLHWTRTYEFKTAPVDTLFFVKSVFMLLLTAPGWYFARESTKHRQVAYKAKTISAELSALPYYLADLDEEKRHEMRMKMADKFFGQELYSEKKSEANDLSEQTKATTETLKVVTTLLSQQSKTPNSP